MTRPILSICLPTRNRQRYLKDLLGFLAENPRDDVEFIIGDNSDDPSIMASVMADCADPRFIALPAPARTLPMIDNWERTALAATGRYVTIVGDDDLVDPDLADALVLAERLKPGLDVLSWNVLSWDWRDATSPPANVAVPISAGFIDLPRDFLFARAFGWKDATAKLTCGTSIYHSAFSAGLIETIRARFDGRLFTHPTVDYDSAFKAIALGSRFAFVARPMSMFGACAESNTAAAHSLARMAQAHANFAAELGRDFDADPYMADFPFPSSLGLTAAIAQVQHCFRVVHGIGMAGWEPGFARAAAENCSFYRERAEFDQAAAAYRAAFARWQGGRWLSHFNPVWQERQTGLPFTGIRGKDLYVDAAIGGAVSPSDFYRIINALLVRPAEIAPRLGKIGS